MKKVRLAVIFDQKLQSGGGYQQSINAALIAKSLPAELADVIFYTTEENNIKMLKQYGISANLIKFSFLSKLRIFLYRKINDRYLLNFFRFFEKNNPRENKFIEDKIDIVYFLSPTSWPIDLEKINYITTIWDMSHRDDLEFPEVRWHYEFERRENNFKSILPKALSVLVDSENSKLNIIRRYGIDYSRVNVMPFQASITTRSSSNSNVIIKQNIKKKYNLKLPFVFYPAQFWSHKNHVYILKGLKYLESEYGILIGAVFSGTDKGNLEYIREKVKNLCLTDRIYFVGFLPNEEIPEFYRQSLALVMPTYFGPTNLPPLEAFEIGTPVLYPDKKEMREQVEGAALLFDLKNFKSMAEHIKNLIGNEKFRNETIKQGKNKIEYYKSINQLKVLKTIIDDFRYKRDCWK